MSEANKRQVAGEHYKSEFQHWDWITAVRLPYLPATLTKYVIRWKKKNGVQDIKKAQHYLAKFLEKETAKYDDAIALTNHFIMLNELDVNEATLLKALVSYQLGDLNLLRVASISLERLLDEATSQEMGL